MIENLTVSERRSAMLILGALALVGLAMAAACYGDPMGVHGFIVLVCTRAVLFFIVGEGIYAPEPPISRLDSYYDDPTKVGIILALVWAVVGMFVGVWVAALLAWPDLRFDAAWSASAGCGRCTPRA